MTAPTRHPTKAPLWHVSKSGGAAPDNGPDETSDEANDEALDEGTVATCCDV